MPSAGVLKFHKCFPTYIEHKSSLTSQPEKSNRNQFGRGPGLNMNGD